MPMYERKCSVCNLSEDYLERMESIDPIECPNCHQEAMARVLTACSFHIVGYSEANGYS